MIDRVRALALAMLLAAAGAAHAEPIPPPPAGEPPPPLDVDRPYEGPPELLFISPAGEPFRGPLDSPYPVAVWFARADKNADGVLTVEEFTADALVFFDVLDADKDGRVDGFENADYEKAVAPEILGIMRRRNDPAGNDNSGGWRKFNDAAAREGRSPLKRQSGKRTWTARREGAAQYGLLNEPHPVRGADADIDGKVSRAEAASAAHRRFVILDVDGDGRLLLADLPRTPAQRAFEIPPQPDKRKR